jgi:hypothetical protein
MKKFVSASLLAFVLLGCGGSNEPSVDNSAKLRGVAVDDLIINGSVKVYPADNTDNILVEGLSDKNGAFSLNVPYNGVVIVEVTCDRAGSWMYNPITQERKECIEDLKLHSVALSSPKKEIEVNVSPISELVVAQMLENGTSKEDLVSAQNSIGHMVGFNPLSQSPVKNDQYVKVIDAIHDMADKDESITLVDIVKSLSDDYKDGKAGEKSGSNISYEFSKAMKKNGAINFLVINEGVVSPVEVNLSKSDISISKDFFDSLRTESMSLVDYKDSGTPGFLDNEAKNLGEMLENITMDINVAGKYTTGIILDVLHLMEENKSEGNRVLNNSKVISYVKSSNEWSYSIKESDRVKYSGTLTLPDEEIEKISLKEFISINAKFYGTLPLEGDGSYESVNRDTRELSRQVQNVKLDILLNKKDYGADLVLTNFSLNSDDTSLQLNDLKIQAYYSFNNSNELLMNHIQFSEATISGDVKFYNITGKLDVSEYVKNKSIKDNNFKEDVYKTNVYGNVLCLDEHNQKMDHLSNTIVTYSDKSGITHNLEANEDGSFWSKIDGNVENLDPYDFDGASSNSASVDYNNYVGLEFDEFELKSASCDGVKIDYFRTDDGENSTRIEFKAFCIEDGVKTDLDSAYIKFKSLEDENLLELDQGIFSTTIDKNLQELGIVSLKREYKAAGVINKIDRDNLNVTTDSCSEPIITYFDFSLDSNENFYNSGIIPKKLNFDGDIKNSNNGSILSAKIDFDLLNAKSLDLMNNDKPEIKVNLVGKIKMSERPEIALSLGFNNQNLKNHLSFSYMNDRSIVNGEGVFDKEMLNGSVVLSTPYGVKLNTKIVEGNIVYDSKSKLTHNGLLVGMVEEIENIPMIKYTDGTFEALP